MKNIKVNNIAPNGNRTSTTINFLIASFWFNTIYGGSKVNPATYSNELKTTLQVWIDGNKYKDKMTIESDLLSEIYEAGRKDGMSCIGFKIN